MNVLINRLPHAHVFTLRRGADETTAAFGIQCTPKKNTVELGLIE
jgi:hypothetical protein